MFNNNFLSGKRQKICRNKLLSKPNATQLNSTQSNSNITNVGVRHSSHVFHPPPTNHPPTTTNFSATSRPARELQAQTLTRPI